MPLMLRLTCSFFRSTTTAVLFAALLTSCATVAPRKDGALRAVSETGLRPISQTVTNAAFVAETPSFSPSSVGGERQAPVTGDYDGPQRFPVLTMKVTIGEDRVPLMGEGRVRARVDNSLKLERDRRDNYAQILCNYGPFPDGGADWGILFWKGKRPALAPQVVEELKQRNPMLAGTMVDVSISACPRTWGQAVAIANRTAAPASVEDDIAADIAKSRAGGLRFTNQLMKSALTDDTTSRLIRGNTPTLAQLKKYDEGKQGHTFRAGGFDGIIGIATPEIAAEVDKLIALGHELLTCSYGFQDPKHGLIIRDGSNFWFKKRPLNISDALAKRIQISNYPLVDVALEKCPNSLAEAIGYSFGTSGKWANEAQAKAAALVASRMNLCDRLLKGEGKASGTGKGSVAEPTAGEMCQSLQAFLEEKFEAQGNSITGSMHPEVGTFEKQACKPNGSGEFRCTFRASYIVKLRGGAMQKIQGMPTELVDPIQQYSRVFVSSFGAWNYVPEVQMREAGSRGGSSSTGRDTMVDSFMERDRDNLQNYYDKSQGRATGAPVQSYDPSRRY